MDAVLHSSKSMEWRTPPELFTALDRKYSFTLDPAATLENALAPTFYTVDGLYHDLPSSSEIEQLSTEDGLTGSWQGNRVFVNPPYGTELRRWVRKCFTEATAGDALIVALLPACVGTLWWHRYVAPYADVEFLLGRLRFLDADGATRPPAPFDSAIVRYR